MANYDLKYDRKSRKKEYLEFLSKKGIKCNYLSWGARCPHQCLTCGRKWETRPSYVSRTNSGCTACAHRGTESTRSLQAQERYAKVCKKKKVELAEPYKGMLSTTLHKCLKCGTEWRVKPNDICNAKDTFNRCPTCKKATVSQRKLRSKQELKKYIEDKGKKKVLKIERRKVEGKTKHRITYICLNCNTKYRTTKGVNASSHCADCGRRASLRLGFSSKTLVISGASFRVMGFEDVALHYLIETKGVKPSRIEAGDSIHIPKIKYLDQKGLEHTYYPDMFIEDLNRIVEVKSTYTLSNHSSDYYTTRAKAIACLEQGYDFRLLMPKLGKNRTCKGIFRIPKNWTTLSWRKFKQEFAKLNDLETA